MAARLLTAVIVPLTSLLLGCQTAAPPTATPISTDPVPSEVQRLPMTATASPPPTITAAAAASPTATEFPLPSDVEFFFQGQSAENEALIRRGVSATYAYLDSLGVEDPGPLVMYVYEDKALLVQDATSRFGYHNGIGGIQAGSGMTHGRGVVYFWTGQPSGLAHNDLFYLDMGSGLLEAVFENLAGDRPFMGGQLGGEAAWLILGATTHIRNNIMMSAGYDTTRDRYDLVHEAVSHVAGNPGELSQYEYYYGANTNQFGYWGSLACEYLATLAPDGAASFFHFYELLGQSMEWHIAFEQAFEITVSDFYAQWNAYRQQRYPIFYQSISGRLYRASGEANTEDIWVWICPPEPSYECVPYLFAGIYDGQFFSTVPLDEPILIAFGSPGNQTSIFGYYHRLETPSPSGATPDIFADGFDEIGVVTPDRSEATLITISQLNETRHVKVTLP